MFFLKIGVFYHGEALGAVKKRYKFLFYEIYQMTIGKRQGAKARSLAQFAVGVLFAAQTRYVVAEQR